MDLVAISKDEDEDNGKSNNMKPTKHTAQSIVTVMPKGQGDTLMEPEINKQIEGNKTEIPVTDDLLPKSISKDRIENLNKHKENEVIIKQEHINLEDSTLNLISEVISRDENKSPVNIRSPEKPSAVVFE